MDLLETITGKFSSMVGTTADVVKVGFAITTLFEVVYGPITGIGGDLSAFHSGSDTPPHRVLSYFLFCRRRDGHIGTGDTGSSREIRRRMVLNSCREMATSAIWNVTYRAWVTTLVPILISFSLKVVIDQCLTLGGEGEPTKKVAQVVCQGEQLQPHLIVQEVVTRKSSPFYCILAFLDPLLRRAAPVVRLHYRRLHLLFYYAQVLGLPGRLAGAAIFIALCVDALTDPLVGSFSDNLHSRWGRRHPLMYASAIPMSVSIYLLFRPPAELSSGSLFVWFCVLAIFVRTAMTFFSVPNAALLVELTSDYDERTTLASYRLFFMRAGSTGTALAGFLYFFTGTEGFEDGRLDPATYKSFALFCAVIIFLAIIVSAGYTHRIIPKLKAPPPASPFTMRRFGNELREVLSNTSFRVLLLGSVFCYATLGLIQAMSLYVNTYYWELSSEDIGALVIAIVCGLIVAVLLAKPLTARFGKKQIVVALLGFILVFGPLPIVLRLFGLMPANGHAALLPLILAHIAVFFAAMSMVSIAATSMFADTTDEGELRTGKRQEGMYMAATTFAQKTTSGLGGLLAGFMIDMIDFSTQAAPGDISPEKLRWLGVIAGSFSIWLVLPALWFISRYELTRQTHLEAVGSVNQALSHD